MRKTEISLLLDSILENSLHVCPRNVLIVIRLLPDVVK